MVMVLNDADDDMNREPRMPTSSLISDMTLDDKITRQPFAFNVIVPGSRIISENGIKRNFPSNQRVVQTLIRPLSFDEIVEHELSLSHDMFFTWWCIIHWASKFVDVAPLVSLPHGTLKEVSLNTYRITVQRIKLHEFSDRMLVETVHGR